MLAGKKVALVEGDQVVAADAVDVLVLLAPAVRIVAAVNLLVEFALDDVVRLVVAPGDPAANLVLGEIEFLLPELRRREQIAEDGEHFVGVLLQRGEGDPAAALADVALDRCGDVLELLVELVAGLGRGSAGAHDHSGHRRQADLVLGIEQISGPHQGESADQRQLVIFEQVQPHAVGQRDLLDVRYFDFLERREFEVFVGRDRRGGGRRRLRQQQRGQCHQEERAFHCVPPWRFGWTVSATVLPLGTKYFRATRWTSSAVTLFKSSSEVKSLRQSP